jgi:tetratricopeptide (TPR) repeat protein
VLRFLSKFILPRQREREALLFAICLSTIALSSSFAAANGQSTQAAKIKDSTIKNSVTENHATKNVRTKSTSTTVSSSDKSTSKTLTVKNTALNTPVKSDGSAYTADLRDTSIWRIPLQSRILMVNILEKHYSRQDLEKIIAAQSGLLSVDPNEAGSLLVRGFAQWKLDRYHGALLDLEKTLKVYPKIEEVNFFRVLGECYLQRGETGRAIECFSMMIKIKPKFVLGYLRRCQTFLETKEYAKALPDANKVVQFGDRDTWTLELRARVNRLNGRYAEAVADCTEAMHQAPNSAGLYDERSKAYEKLGKKDLAEKDKKVWNQFSREALLDTMGE